MIDSKNSQINSSLVTVLMSVYKPNIDLLKRSVNSILNQTYRNIEFIIIDDGAGEEALSYLNAIDDNRVRLIKNEHNIGLASSLNKGIAIASGEFIARMDADDYSLPNRIYEQVKYLQEHSDVDVLTCVALDIRNGKLTGGIGGAYRKFDNFEIKIELSLAPKTFPHPATVFRSEFLRANNLLYDPKLIRAQDYDMWARCSAVGKLDSLQKVLLLYDQGDRETTAPSELQVKCSNITKLKCLERLLPNSTDREKELYVHMREMDMFGGVSENIELVRKLILANSDKKLYSSVKLTNILYFWWGRKMLYSCNRSYLREFLADHAFFRNVVRAYFNKLPGHLLQQRYEKVLLRKAMKSNELSDWV